MDNKLLKTFGINVKIERIKKGCSQEQVAEALSISAVYLSNVESGKHNLSLSNAFKLAKYYGKTIDYLITEKA